MVGCVLRADSLKDSVSRIAIEPTAASVGMTGLLYKKALTPGLPTHTAPMTVVIASWTVSRPACGVSVIILTLPAQFVGARQS